MLCFSLSQCALTFKVEAKGNASKCALLVPLCLLFLEFFCRLVLDVPLGKFDGTVYCLCSDLIPAYCNLL